MTSTPEERDINKTEKHEDASTDGAMFSWFSNGAPLVNAHGT